MPTFITKVALLDATEQDYANLHTELSKLLFKNNKKRNAIVTDSLTQQVEYIREGDITLQQVTGDAWNAARRTGKKYTFTVIRNKEDFSLHFKRK